MPNYILTLSRTVIDTAEIVIAASSEKRAIAELEAYPEHYMARAEWDLGPHIVSLDPYPKLEKIEEIS